MHPYLLFPHLFFLAPLYVPLLLRLVAAAVFLYMAYWVYKNRAGAARVSYPVIGVQSWVPVFTVVVYALIGLSLTFGYYTQIGAIFGAIAALKELFWGKRLQSIIPLSRMSSLLLLAMCLSLVLSGAGALAMDVPL